MTWEAAFEKARAKGDEAGMKSADHYLDEYGEQIKALMGFKSDLGRFCRTYSYNRDSSSSLIASPHHVNVSVPTAYKWYSRVQQHWLPASELLVDPPVRPGSIS